MKMGIVQIRGTVKMAIADSKIAGNVAGGEIQGAADPGANDLDASFMNGGLFIATEGKKTQELGANFVLWGTLAGAFCSNNSRLTLACSITKLTFRWQQLIKITQRAAKGFGGLSGHLGGIRAKRRY